MKPIFLRTEYNYDRNKASDEHGLACNDKSLAQQHFKDQCDINVLFGKYLETGTMPQVDDLLYYGDFTGKFDFQEAMNEVLRARQNFDQLPARIKNRFDNDPGKLIAFLENPENREEAQFLQLIAQPDTIAAPDVGAPIGAARGTQSQGSPTPDATAQGGSPASGASADTRTPQGTKKP